jgi:uncharacterized membrane protein
MSTPNPYAAPKAPVADAPEAVGNFLPNGRSVGAGRGWSWIAEGFELFKRQPGIWIALIIVAFVIFLVMGFVPFIGSLAAMVLSPVFAGGIVIGCRALEQDGELELGHLFAGFSQRFGPLATVGAIYLAAAFVIALAVGLVTGAGVWSILSGGGADDPAAVAGMGLTILLALLIMLALLIPVFMAMWFAPPLIVFHDMGAVQAMKASFVGCLKNIIPFLIYGVILFVFAIFASIPFLLGWLVLGPTMAGSLYTAYRDIYFE